MLTCCPHRVHDHVPQPPRPLTHRPLGASSAVVLRTLLTPAPGSSCRIYPTRPYLKSPGLPACCLLCAGHLLGRCGLPTAT